MTSVRGLGTDIVEVARVARLLERPGGDFLQRWYRPAERQVCSTHEDPALAAACLLAAKESILKAVGGPSPDAPPWRDIEVLLDPGDGVGSGEGMGLTSLRPTGVRLYGQMRHRERAAGIRAWSVSVSGHGRYAAALTIAW